MGMLSFLHLQPKEQVEQEVKPVEEVKQTPNKPRSRKPKEGEANANADE